MKLFILILILFNCKPEIKSKLIAGFVLSSGVVNNTPQPNNNISPPSNFSYPKTNYFFRINRSINTITPVITGLDLRFSISPSLPNGIRIDSGTGIITGTGLNIQTTSNYTVTASNSAGSVQVQINITVVGLLPLKTGYSFCWDSLGLVISCVGTGQDGEYQNGTVADFSNPTDSATYPNEFITTDNLTGLKWVSCIVGLSDNTCSTGGATIGNLNSASTTLLNTYNTMNSGLGYAGINTWRLPTISELERIHLPSISSPSTYTAPFPATPSSGIWSSTINPTNALAALIVNFTGNGRVDTSAVSSNNRIRYVSGNSVSEILVDNSDGTILDVTTGLVWQKCSFGLSDKDCLTGAVASMVWSAALNNCNTLSLANYTWRLPNVNELKSVLNRTASPVLNSTFFPLAPAAIHFTSTTPTLTAASAYRINFAQGIIDLIAKTSTANFKCVASQNID